MTAELIDLSTLLAREVTYRIPLYQRPYGWSEELCHNLVEDFQELEANPSAIHYLGNLVVQAPKEGPKTQDVIDGQQRLTSLFLMLDAMGHGASNYCEKLIPQSTDGATDIATDYLKPENDQQEEVWRNFNVFGEKKIQLNEELLRRVKVSLVTLYSNEQESPNGISDCSQTVFEKMNVEGLNLSSFDLVQNALFMRARELQPEGSQVDYRRRLNEIWQNVTELFESERDSLRLEFLQDFLILRKWSESDKDKAARAPESKLVKEFEQVLQKEGGSIQQLEKLVSEMWRHAEAWVAVRCGRIDGVDSEMSSVLAKLSRALTTNATPLAVEMFLRSTKFGKRERETFVGFIKAILIDNFLNTKVQLGDWLGLLKNDDKPPTIECFKNLLDEKHGNFSDELKKQLTGVSSDEEDEKNSEQEKEPNGEKAPDGSEKDLTEEDSVEYVNVYAKQGRLIALLEVYEDTLTAGNLDTAIQYVGGRPTLEHIVPQNPRPGEEGRPSEWGEVRGEFCHSRGELCHSLGNLTLLGGRLNSSVGNRSPLEKEKAYRTSNFAMTRRIAEDKDFRICSGENPPRDLDCWSQYIKKRTAYLAKELVKALAL